ARVPGVENPGIFRIQGQSNLEFPVDREKCARWGVSASDVGDTIQTAVGGKAVTQMIEGERSFDVTLRFPARHRRDEQAILNIPADVVRNRTPDPSAGPPVGPVAAGTRTAAPARTGSLLDSAVPILAPRRRLGDLVTPDGVGADGRRQ